MSKRNRPIPSVLIALAAILQFFTIAAGQDIEARIKIAKNSPSAATVSGRFVKQANVRNLSFLLNYAEIAGLGARISNVEAWGADRKPVALRRMIAGEYLADTDIYSWSYTVDLTPLKVRSAAAHISWFNGAGGILMLDDILPHMGRKTAADISLEIPPGLAAAATVQPGGAEKLFVGDVEKAVVFLAADCRQRRIGTNGSLILLNLSGDWLFSDDEAAAMASEIVSAYGRLFGSVPAGEIDVNIRKFPDPVAVGNWEADTRGRTVTIVSSDMPFKSQSAQRLHEQLRHEIFHLWFPNGVNLSGNYDWFYEGFALYRSLKMGVGGNRLRFDDYLESLSQAYNLDAIQIDRYSLIDASARRWAGGNSTVYARGMLAAFLCDLAMLRASKGRSSVDDLLREVFQRGSSATRADGNETVLAAMRAHPELGPIIDKYVLSKAKIDWRAELLSAGITPGDDPSFARLAVVPAPNGRQRDLLDKLGYNNWRKLTKSSK